MAEIPNTLIDQWTSLEKVIEVCRDVDSFLTWKVSFVGRIDEDEERETWERFRTLLLKAVRNTLSRYDRRILREYLDAPSATPPALRLVGGKILVPVLQVQGGYEINWRALNTEINRRIFRHVEGVAKGEKNVAICAAEGCENFFIPETRGIPQRYCSKRCSSREGMRRFRERKKKLDLSDNLMVQ